MQKKQGNTPAIELLSGTPMRLLMLRAIMLACFVVVGVSLFRLQIMEYDLYTALASGRPDALGSRDRGAIYLSDPTSPDGTFPIAVNKNVFIPFADTTVLRDPEKAALQLGPVLGAQPSELLALISERRGNQYVVLGPAMSDTEADEVRALGIRGIGLKRQRDRYYPEGRILGHVTGFLGASASGPGKEGKYGVEGNMDKALAGEPGEISGSELYPAQDGADLTLTIDRSIQYAACERLERAVKEFEADGGTVVIADPKTGAILGMCSVPNFDPNDFRSVPDIGVFNNPAVFGPYEPGSVFKPLVMAAALDAGAVSPNTTFEDTGAIKIGPFTIKNSDGKAHGIQTMTQVLEESLNTGMIFIVGKLGAERFLQYVESFGFGHRTGVELDGESAGNIESLRKRGDIWSATGSFGQGITTTPVQLVAAYGAVANGGKLMKPYIVASKKLPDGREVRTEPVEVRQVITRRAAALAGGMLVSVVENGHGKRAAVPGYWVGGKTGTAQVAKQGGGGYDEEITIGSFVGYAPVDHPEFVMAVKLVNPRKVEWAESSAAPLFGDIAKFLLQYMQVAPDRK